MNSLAAMPALRWLALLAVLLAAILLPFALLGDELARLASDTAARLADRQWLVLALVVALLALDPLLPVPSSIVAVAAGSALGATAGALAIFAGLMLGAALGYWLGRHPGRAIAARLLGAQQLAALGPAARPVGPLLLLLSRPVPVVAEAMVILAGAARLPLSTLLAGVVPANAALALLWGGLGAVAGAGQGPVAGFAAVLGAIILPALAHAFWHLRRA